MFEDNTTTQVNSSSSASVDTRWSCSFYKGTIAHRVEFWWNSFAVTFVSGVMLIIALLLNALLLYLFKTHRRLRLGTNVLIFFQVVANVSTTLFVQAPLLTVRIVHLADLHNTHKKWYCIARDFSYSAGHVALSFLLVVTCAVSCERYLAIYHPTFYRARKRHGRKPVIFVAVTIILLSTAVTHYTWHQKSKSTFAGFILGVYIFMIFTYVRINAYLKNCCRQDNISTALQVKAKKAQRASLLSLCFLLCYFSLILAAVVQAFDVKTRKFVEMYIRPWAVTLTFLPAVTNPLILCRFDPQIGPAFADLWRGLVVMTSRGPVRPTHP